MADWTGSRPSRIAPKAAVKAPTRAGFRGSHPTVPAGNSEGPLSSSACFQRLHPDSAHEHCLSPRIDLAARGLQDPRRHVVRHQAEFPLQLANGQFALDVRFEASAVLWRL